MIERGLRDVYPAIDAMPLEQARLAKELATTLFMSFYVTQTNANAQKRILELSGQYYFYAITFEDFAAIPDTAHELEPHLADVLLPSHHGSSLGTPSAGKKKLSRHKIVGPNFSEFLGDLVEGVRAVEMNALDRKRLAANAVWDLIQSDINYVEKGRPNPELRDDPHSSIFRGYVLLGEPTGSAALDGIRSELFDAAFTGKGNRQRLSELEDIWHEKHPGDIFYEGVRPSYDELPLPSTARMAGAIILGGRGTDLNRLFIGDWENNL